MGKIVKFSLTAIALAGGYYLYQSQITGKRADVLAKQDFNRITSSINGNVGNKTTDDWRAGAEQQWKNAQKEANKQWNQVSQSARGIYDSANKQLNEVADKAKKTGENVEKQENESSKSWYETVTGWFGKK